MPEQKIYLSMAWSSRAIQERLRAHPIVWGPLEHRKIGGYGDQAGLPPNYVMVEFNGYVDEYEEIPTADEMWRYLWTLPLWRDWLLKLSPQVQDGFKTKVQNNFYVGAITALHVFALLSEMKRYDKVRMSTHDDTKLGVDLRVYRQRAVVKIDLKGPETYNGTVTKAYRETYRPRMTQDVIDLKMSAAPKSGPGNIAWYTEQDLVSQIDPLLDLP